MKNAVRLPSDPSSHLRVFVVESSPLVCERIEDMLDSIEGVHSVGHAAGADEAITGILDLHPHAVVLDVRLAQGTGFDVLRALRERAPEITVYMLSNFASEPYRRLAARLGAAGFFDKTTQFEHVCEALAGRAARTLN
ncbi:MAG TPA: response regulator transcription factor [Burkholderiales bacterium]|jgi:DNA-binding NarL/FixJ family response regulator|nr:response regulator transcription factor [Burkholderiales bacterium]